MNGTNLNIEELTADFKEPVVNPIMELLEKAQINTNKRLDKIPALMSIVEGNKIIDIMTEGNISVIKGRAKARKSFAIAMMIGAYLSNQPLFRTFKAQSQKVCVLFDTEQSSFYVQQSMYRIMDISDANSYQERFFAFCLRPYQPDKRLEMIEYFLYNLQNNGLELGLIVIDGIRDLIRDINSADEATMISSKLLKWTEETGCHILNVIHENKGGGEGARGHLGTELINKAETILRIEKLESQTSISKISAEMTRGIDFEDIYFTVNSNIPMVVDQNSVNIDIDGL